MKLRTILELQADYGWQIPRATRDAWRPLWPNLGELRGLDELGRVRIVATDGCLAAFLTNSGASLLVGHLANFIGPVAKEEVHEEDWNFDRNTRVVKVFRRKDGSCAIIPQDTFLVSYFEQHPRLDAIERQVYEGIGYGVIAPQDFENTVARLREAKAAAAPRKAPSRKQDFARILALI